MPAQGAFPHFLVGRVAALADEHDATTLFEAMRTHGRWAALPAGAVGFWRHVQPVVIDADGAALVALTSQEDAQAVPVRPGDLVRYSPHRGRFETPPTDPVAASYYVIYGCVEILCRKGDDVCAAHYAPGVFRSADGMQLSIATLRPAASGIRIDLETMFPRQIHKSK